MAEIQEKDTGRQVNVDLNIVPFIDLMSVLVIFLLITAVWTQVSMIQIGSSMYGKRTSDEPVDIPPQADIPFRVDVRADGYRVVVGRESQRIEKVEGEYDLSGLLRELRRVKELYPEKVDAVITVEDELPYKTLIWGMDSLLAAGFPQISVATGGVQ